MNTRVILRQDIPSLGHTGDAVEVRPGYARNYLFPKGLAYPYSEDSLLRVEKDRILAAEKRAAQDAEFSAVAERISSVQLTFEEKVSPEGHLYGSVSAARIAEALGAQGFEIEERQIRLAEPLRQIGEFTVPVHVHGELEAQVKVWVVSVAPATPPAEA